MYFELYVSVFCVTENKKKSNACCTLITGNLFPSSSNRLKPSNHTLARCLLWKFLDFCATLGYTHIYYHYLSVYICCRDNMKCTHSFRCKNLSEFRL